ncbi:MAG: phosphoadenylyl-sulfate reductase [Armatimonadota bacterium]
MSRTGTYVASVSAARRELDSGAENLSAAEVIAWGVETFGDRIALACSLGAEDMVLADMLSRIAAGARVFTLDTGRLHKETQDLLERARERFDLRFEVYSPDAAAVAALAEAHGRDPFYKSVELRKLCCEVRKMAPLRRALSGLDAWICGLRREQAVTRKDIQKIEKDAPPGGLCKLNPLADWTEDQVWDYIRGHDVPYNDLHDRGFPSIGCAPCTRAVQPGEDVRAGRWWWELPEQKECGLHVRR